MPPAYYYPNRMGRILLASMRKELGHDGFQSVLKASGQTQFSTSNLLPNNLEKRFPFEVVSALQAGTEAVFGARAGRQLNHHIGHGTFELGLKDFDPVLGVADLPLRLMPVGMKFRIGLDVFARVFNQFSDQVVKLSDTATHHLWIIERCPVCWGRQTDEPCCHLAAGLLEEAVFWAAGGKRFRIEEVECVAQGRPACKFQIDKQPTE